MNGREDGGQCYISQTCDQERCYVTVDNGACVTTKLMQNLTVTTFFRRFAINENDVSAGKSNRKCHSIYLRRYSLRFGNLRRGNRFLE